MKKKALIFGVIFGFLMLTLATSQVFANSVQEQQPTFKMISPQELAKELRNPNSERLKAWGYLIEFDMSASSLNNWLSSNPEILNKVKEMVEADQEMQDYLKEDVNVAAILLDQNFKSDEFNQEFDKLRKAYKKVILVVQQNLDSSQEEHVKESQRLAEFLKKLDDLDLFTTKGLLQYQADYSRAYYVYSFINLWARSNSVALDDTKVNEIIVVVQAIGQYLASNADKNSKEFQTTIAEYLKTLYEKIEELIKFIEFLPATE